MDSAVVFVSVLPGRIRLRHPLLRDRARHAALCDRLRALVEVEGYPGIGSLLLRYDPADLAMEAHIRAEVDAVFLVMPATGPVDQPDARSGPNQSEHARTSKLRRQVPTRTTINRIAKIGGLAGLVGSVAALGVSRRLHAQIGVLAVAMTLTHAAVHWRRTFR